MRIPDETVEEVRAAADIVDVVSDYVRLKKRGTNFIGLCPFHTEKTPSFNVNTSLGIYKCFGCGEGGDVFNFISRVEGLGFPEGVRMLAERLGITIPDAEPDEAAAENEAIYHALRFAARFFYRRLTQAEDGGVARSYLQSRGVSAAMIKRFGVGYAPDAWDALLEHATEEQLTPEILEKAGLILSRRDSDGYYDRYRHRVIFPIFSHVGKVLGFGGRILVKDPSQPKYVNSPETAVYHKGRVLYGLYQAKQAVRRREEAVLVEGYTDVLALHQAGVEHVVASSGTALTGDQVRLIGRYARRVLLLYDADEAGLRAAKKGIDLLLAEGLTPYVVALPEGEDPDSYVKQFGAEAFEKYLRDHRQDFVTYLYRQADAAGRLESADDRAAVQHKVLETVGRIPDRLLRESYLRQASDVLDVPEGSLRFTLRDADRKGSRREKRATSSETPIAAQPAEREDRVTQVAPLPEEKVLIRLMLERGSDLVSFILTRMSLEEFTEGPARSTCERLVALFGSGQIETRPFLDGTFGTDVQELATEVLTDALEPSENWLSRQIQVPRLNDDPYAAASSAMTLLKLDRLDELISRVKQRIFHAEQDGGDVRTLQEEWMGLQKLRKEIEDRQFLSPNK